MSTAADNFSASYAEARSRLHEAARSAGLAVESIAHPLAGAQGEPLALDIVRDGPADAKRVLFLSSACHGVEGFCGSGVQLAALRDAAWRERARSRGVAVVVLHALNPHGFSHLRRVTQENVDLNRNFQEFSQPLPRNEGYARIHGLLLPAQWPPTEAAQAELMAFVAQHGMRAFQAAMSGGQHEFPDGLFYGGNAPTWSNQAVREALRRHGRRAEQAAWIDFHTGLGPQGVGERIYSGPDEPNELARARAWWDGGGRTPVTSFHDGSSTSAPLTGLMYGAAAQECPQAEWTGLALEYGTEPWDVVAHALRADHWLHLHSEAPAAQAQAIHRQMRDAFYTDTDTWKAQVLAQAFDAMDQAVTGLSA